MILELSKEREKKLRTMLKGSGLELPDLLTMFAEDLADGQENSKRWFDQLIHPEKEEEFLKELYFIWMKEYSEIDGVCESLEGLFEENWKSREEKVMELLSQMQEKVFWEGAITVNRWKSRLEHLTV